MMENGHIAKEAKRIKGVSVQFIENIYILLTILKGATHMSENMIGFRVVGIIKEVKGSCSVGHKAGDELELSMYNTGGLCGAFYHDVFPYVLMLQMGGSFPAEWGEQDLIELDCMDKYNAVTIQLKRVKA